MKLRVYCFLLGLALLLAGCVLPAPQALLVSIPADTTQEDTTPDLGVVREDDAGRRADLVVAFFGLDNDLPRMSNVRICQGAGNADGMPVIFSHEIDMGTLQAGDFQVVSESGSIGTVICVTLAPALDPGELRTALLAGEFGTADENRPVRVEIVGNVLSLDGRLNFRGASIDVTPLAAGPSLALAEVVPETQWKLEQEGGSWSVGSGCPIGTVQVVRAVWQGGITKPGGDEVGDAERLRYSVTLTQNDGTSTAVIPIALGDLDDGDNNHLLCLDVAGTPVSVAFPAGYVTDPNEDLNPDASVRVAN